MGIAPPPDSIPSWVKFGIRALPLPVLDMALRRLVVRIIRDHPDVIGRLGGYASTIFLIEPTDFPIQFCLRLDSPAPIATKLRSTVHAWDARITGPIATLFAMLDGALDGDALFFSRDITIEGDTDAILALRNAIDAAEIDLPNEVARQFGPLSPAAKGTIQIAIPILNRLFSKPPACRGMRA